MARLILITCTMIVAFVHMGSATTPINVIQQDCTTLANNMQTADTATKNACDAKVIDLGKYKDTTNITNLLNNLTSNINTLIPALNLATNNALVQSLQTISTAIAAIVQAAIGLIPFLTGISTDLAGILQSISTLLAIVVGLTGATLTSLTTSLKSTVQKSLQEVLKLADDLLSNVGSMVFTQVGNIKNALAAILNVVSNEILPQVVGLTGDVAGLVVNVLALLCQLQFEITNLTNDILQDVFFLLESVITSVENTVTPVITTLTDTLGAIEGCATCLNTDLGINLLGALTRRRRSIKQLV